MKIPVFVSVIAIAVVSIGYGQEHTNQWPGIITMDVDNTAVGIVRFSYHPKVTTLLNNIDKDLESQIKRVKVGIIRLTENKKDTYYVEYDEGPSVDPTFRIYNGIDDKGQKLLDEFGMEMIVPGDGSVYISGHTNNMYNQRKRFDLKNGKLVEVTQPFYYVGLKSRTNIPLSMYAELNQKAVIAKLHKGSKVEVLLNKGDFYLIKTEFGLVGWSKLHSGNRDAEIEGIYYEGD